jgi:hypothetical protein
LPEKLKFAIWQFSTEQINRAHLLSFLKARKCTVFYSLWKKTGALILACTVIFSPLLELAVLQVDTGTILLLGE